MNQLFADRFRSARALSGMSLQDLANKLGNKVSRQALHKYEKGEVIPDSQMIGHLCQALNVRPDFFFRELKVELGEIEFRKLKNLPAKEENRIIEEVKDKLSRYLELEEILSIQTQFVNPLKHLGDIHSFEEIEVAAAALRVAWNLGKDPIFNAVELLEDNHIKVVEVSGGDSFDGMQTWVNGKFPVIAINIDKVKSSDRIRFTILHELCHLLLRLKHLSEKQKEKFCHQFAAAMLLPAETAVQELGAKRNKVMIQELGALKKQYGISIQAIVMRAKDLGILSESYCKQFFFMMNQMGWKVNEPVEYEGVEKSNRFEQLLFRALGEELISMSKAAALNNQTLAEFREKSLVIA
ncbi:MAG: ImmA/IrrE family metallo-endopeptidase [Sediminibacterium magnilacihabitans]|jgi:Zn-dependent peptidase ImmA (M78 family)/DNA-binding XRE family transcriptional regulator|nr:ImmA/IrrE family metallo-endopeptidase [Sediminibacterium magnilacihabitans]PQV60570.1 Zn-dependent peptidase ImmA (M78 family) [Sediminibacterium magnilacihabitans]